MAYNPNAKFWRSQLRIPANLIDWVKERTAHTGRSLNSEIVEMIRDAQRRESEQRTS